jgi:hypothetical protein
MKNKLSARAFARVKTVCKHVDEIDYRSVGSRPPAIITWWKRGKFMGKPTEEVGLFCPWLNKSEYSFVTKKYLYLNRE